jgi:hypothetical protein
MQGAQVTNPARCRQSLNNDTTGGYMPKVKLRCGKEIIDCPPAMIELADRLAREQMKLALYSDRPISETLGTIYLMGFIHAFDAIEAAESRSAA